MKPTPISMTGKSSIVDRVASLAVVSGTWRSTSAAATATGVVGPSVGWIGVSIRHCWDFRLHVLSSSESNDDEVEDEDVDEDEADDDKRVDPSEGL